MCLSNMLLAKLIIGVMRWPGSKDKKDKLGNGLDFVSISYGKKVWARRK